MCNIDHSRYERILKARGAAEDILERYHRVRLQKAWSLRSAKGFDRAVAELSSLLRSATGATDKAALKAVIDGLDVNWFKTTAKQRRRLVNDALVNAGRKTAIIPRKIRAPLGDAAEEVIRATKKSVRATQNLAINADFNAIDKRIIKHLKTSEANFITDEYGRRLDAFGVQARDIVSRGIKQGLGNDAISQQLRTAAQAQLVNRSKHYFDTVANSFIGRGRTFATLSSFNEAGLERYIFEAVLDEATTESCRFYHGKVFTVERGLDLFSQVEENPNAIKELTPWVRKGLDDKGNQFLYVKRNNAVTRVADIAKPALGERDRIGTYTNSLKDNQLSEQGIIMPPLHGLCRSSVVSDPSATTVTPRVARAVPKPPKTQWGPVDVLSSSQTYQSTAGHALPLDGGFVENFDVQFRLEKIGKRELTKVRFKVTDQYAEKVREAILKGDKVKKNDVFRHLEGKPAPKTGRITKSDRPSSLEFKAISSSFEDVRVSMVTEKGALTNFVEMDIPSTKAAKAFKAYGETAKRLGIAEATSFPSAGSLDVMRKAKLITQYDRKGWEKLQGLTEINPSTVDPIFRASVKRFPELKDIVKDTKLTQTARGHVALHSKTQAARLKKDGVAGIYHDIADPEIIVAILKDPHGSGLLSSTQRYNRGIFVNGMSTQADFRSGGADGVFTRIATKGILRKNLASYEGRVIIDTEQLGRSDWYHFNRDLFGAAGPNQFRTRTLIPEMKSTLKNLYGSNEMVFQHGIPVEALKGMVILDSRVRNDVLTKLRAAGITMVNDIPIERFIMSKEPY